MRRWQAGKKHWRSIALSLAMVLPGDVGAQQLGFSISVDGEHVAGDPVPPEVTAERETDLSLARADIQITYDGLDATPMLNVLPTGLRAVSRAGESVQFVLGSNYPAWIDRAEIGIVDARTGELVQTLPAVVNGTTAWTVPPEGGPDFTFAARVYDVAGRYDETRPLLIHRTESPAAETPDEDFSAAGWGTDRTHRRGIPIYGGAVTVHGTEVPAGASVRVLGEPVPVDQEGAFVIERLLPAGDHVVDVAIGEPGGAAMVFNRAVNIPTEDWFYVAMADLTVGTRWGSGRIIAADPSEFDQIYVNGRTAFYLKGKIRGQYLLTASGDTGEGPVSEMLSGPLSKDPQALLRRIDPSQYYPVYGDDSVLVDDAPTHGKLYVRLERGPSHVMWGDFRTVVGESSLFRTARVLYGASTHYESDEVTATGRPRVTAGAYAAQPDSLPARDVLRGTGGSAYVLRRQDVAIGSETVTIERRSGTTGLLVSSQRLVPGTDYTINYMQGTILLARPLNSSVPSTGAVSSANQLVNLVVQYEYVPTGTDPTDYAVGGHASVWLNDHVQIGVGGLSEAGEQGESELLGAHARIEASEQTFIEAELLHSHGVAAPSWLSTDGGFTYVQQAAARSSTGAFGYRLHARAALEEVLAGGIKGVAEVRVEGRQAGFSTLEEQVASDQLRIAASADIAASEELGLGLGVEHFSDADRTRTEADAEISYRLTEDWEVIVGVSHLTQFRPGGLPQDNGWRTDAGGRLIYAPSDDLTLYGFGQATLARGGDVARNDRLGAGAEVRLTEHWLVSGEVSGGTTGMGVLAALTYEPHVDEQTYIGFRLTPEHAVDDYFTGSSPLDGLVLGTRRRVNEALSMHAENTFGLFEDARSLTSTYGAVFTPDNMWRFAGNLELGRIEDENAADFERIALSLDASYENDGVTWNGRGEIRLEDSVDDTRDRRTYLLATRLGLAINEDWRLLAGIEGLISQSDQTSILDGDYVEGSVGFAYRPTTHDRLNALFRYSYLYDLPGPDQVSSTTGTVLGPAQHSHILSADVNYDLTPHITLGAKYGFRIGEVSHTRSPADFVTSSAHLGILRADIELIEDWSLLLEQRALHQPETRMLDLGTLVAVRYDFNENVSLGVGYNFGRFSDDLRDLTYDDQGVFLNLTAKILSVVLLVTCPSYRASRTYLAPQSETTSRTKRQIWKV